MTFRFKSMPEFDENFSNLPIKLQERVKKKLEKFKEFPCQHIIKTSSMLQAEFRGIRHHGLGRMRLYFRICEECLRHNHDTIHGKCNGCEREEDLIILLDVLDLRRNDTYERLSFNHTRKISSSDFEP